MSPHVRKYMATIGAKGGATVTEARRAANASKAKAAAKARWAKVKVGTAPRRRR